MHAEPTASVGGLSLPLLCASVRPCSVCLSCSLRQVQVVHQWLPRGGRGKDGLLRASVWPRYGWMDPPFSSPVEHSCTSCVVHFTTTAGVPQVGLAVQSRYRCNRSGGITATSPARLAMRRAYEIHVMGEEHGRRGIRFIKAKSVDPSGPHGCLDHLTIPLGFERHRQQVRMPADPPTCRGIGD